MFEEYPNFVYKNYSILEDEDKIIFKYEFEIEGLKKFSFLGDIKLMFMTFFAVCGKEYKR